MGCIIADRGWIALCGKKFDGGQVVEFFNKKITCMRCIVRQDAMFTREYKQQEFKCWVNQWGGRQCIPIEIYMQYGTRKHAIPDKGKFLGSVFMWDMKTLKGAIKLGKIGAHGMGMVKEE